MKLRSLLFASALLGVCAAVCVSVAVAAPTPGKGKPPTTGPNCRPRVALILKGTLARAPGASGTSLSLNVTHANHQAAAYAKASQPISILVDVKTVVRRQGKKTLADLVSGDRVLVQARACKADLANGATPSLTATRIIAHPAAT